MASKTKLYAAVQPMVVLLLLSIGQPATAFRDPSVKHDLLKSTDAPSRIDLASELHHASINQPEFSTALRIIQNYESSPSCNRFAIHSLIKSCQSLEASSQEPPKGGSIEVVLEEVKSEFAARLAICELTGANAAIPPQCSRLIPSHAHCQSSGLGGFFRGTKTRKGGEHELCYPGLTAQQFDQCLRGLESRAQWWTSYSNARQNAVVVCQASRHAIERGMCNRLQSLLYIPNLVYQKRCSQCIETWRKSQQAKRQLFQPLSTKLMADYRRQRGLPPRCGRCKPTM